MESFSSKYVPHNEALRFIKNLERKLKRRARKIQSREEMLYTDAITAACREIGLKDLYQFQLLCRTLRKRADHFARQEDRINSALHEKPEDGKDYYIFSAELDFEDAEDLPGEAYLVPKKLGTLMSTWLGWANEDRTIDLRVADTVDPERSIRKYRELSNNTIYVINSESNLFLWLLAWGGVALIRADLVKNHDVLARWLKPYQSKPHLI